MDLDHKPLETIFGKPLVPALISTSSTKSQHLADTLSQHFGRGQPTRSKFKEKIEQVPLIEEINQLIALEGKMSRLKVETDKDEVLQEVKETIQVGWPDNKNGLSPNIINYLNIQDEVVVQEGVILCGDRVVIPKFLRRETLEDLHTAHQGVESMGFFNSINKEFIIIIINLEKSMGKCLLAQHEQWCKRIEVK